MTRRNFEMLFCCSAEANWWRRKLYFTRATHTLASVATWIGAKDDELASFISSFDLEEENKIN